LFNGTGTDNTAVGTGALLFNTIGEGNTATGAFALYSNTEGDFNTANGEFTLYFNTTGERNTAIGDGALYLNTEGSRNTAIGNPALLNNTTGNDNTATGNAALVTNTSGNRNTAIGAGTLFANDAHRNTATGYQALFNNTTGDDNTATGDRALFSNLGGNGNTANGAAALFSHTTGGNNTANGYVALSNNITGNNNTALGAGAGSNVTTADNVIAIGATGANVSNSTWINYIYGTTTVSGVTLPVIVSTTGQLGTTSSSRRFKDEIKPIDKASEAILALKPVMFHYKSDRTNAPQFGLIAEEVAQVNPDLVVRDENGEIYTVRYDAVNAMLLNEFLKEHRKVQQQEATIADLRSAMARQRKDFETTKAQEQKQLQALTASLKEQASQIQKVSAQIEIRKPMPQTVVNHR
jgi:Chaperone of endosialidase